MTLNSKFIRLLDRYVCWVLCRVIYLFRPSLKKPADACKNIQPSTVKKILLIKFPGIGNVVMMLPAMRAIREYYPDAEITFFTLGRNRQILDHNTFIDKKIFLDVHDGVKFIVSFLRCCIFLQRTQYDIVIDFEQFSKTSSFFVAISHSRCRVGFDLPGHDRGFVYSVRVPYREKGHMADIFSLLPQAIGVPVSPAENPSIPLGPAAYERSKEFLDTCGFRPDMLLVGMHPGTGENFGERKWPFERFAAVADHLIERHNACVYFTGGPDEKKLIDMILSRMRHTAHATVGKLVLNDLAALIERSDMFFSNDTALLHMAVAMGTRVIGFYGPNTPFLYGPRGTGHHVLYHQLFCSPCITNKNQKASSCHNAVCMKSITVDETIEVLESCFFHAPHSPVKSSPEFSCRMRCALPVATPGQDHFGCPVCGMRDLTVIDDMVDAQYPLPFGRMVLCKTCGIRFKEALCHTPAELASFYDDAYFHDGYIEKETAYYLKKDGQAADRLCERFFTLAETIKEKGRLLDIGAGTGMLLDRARSRGWQYVYGVEPSGFAADYATRTFGLNVFAGFLHEAKFPDESFDVVVLWDTLEHMWDPAGDLKEIYRVLAPGGKVFVCTQNNASMIVRCAHWLHKASGGWFRRGINYVYDNCHLFFLNASQLGSLLRTAGFSIDHTEYAPAISRHRDDAYYTTGIVARMSVGVLNMLDKARGKGYRILVSASKPCTAKDNT